MRIDLSLLKGNFERDATLANLDVALLREQREFRGPFAGVAGIEPTDAPAFELDGRWIDYIALAPGAARFDLKVPAPLKFEGVTELELRLSYAKSAGTWTVEFLSVAWLKYGYKAVAGLGQWLQDAQRHGVPVLKLDDQRGFPIDEWGLAVEPMKWAKASEAYAHVMNAGIFADARQRHSLVIVPESNTPFMKLAAPGLNLIGLQGAALGSRASNWRIAPLALSFPLHRGDSPATWRGLVSWAPVQTEENRDDDDRLKIAPILDQLWNRPVERALLGARIEQAAQPVVPLPLLTITETKAGDSREKQAPLLFIETQRDASSNRPGAPRLRRVFLSGSEAITLRADFHLQAKSANEAEPVWASNKAMIRFEGNVQNLLPLIPTDVTGAGATRERLLAALDAALGPVEGSDGDDPLLAWRADGSVTTPAAVDGWIVWGSLQFQVPAGGIGAELECRVRGTWNAQECDAYPEVILDLFGCRIRPSANADSADRDLYAAFGVQSGLEDELQRDSDVLRFARREEQESRLCDIRIRHRTDRGRLAVSRVEVRARDGSRFGDESVVLQLRPFSVAVVQPVDIDAEAGDLIAVWSSNDPEGVQWRVPDATAAITLPAQAVGETMERGARFWKPGATNQTWIDPASPIPYRFSPPTQLVVRPSVRERRYNKSPANFSALLADAKVESFVTETMYPIQASFQVSKLGLPDIRIRETGSMLGRPAENLPPRMDLQEDLKDKKAEDRWFKSMFASEVAAYAATLGLPRDEIIGLRGRQAAAKASFAARLAQYHVYDPWAVDGRLGLAEGLSFRLRDTTYGAPPLLSPLPHWKVENRVQTPLANEDLLPGQKQEIHVEDPTRSPRFLGEGGKWADKDDPDGAFVGGVVHTMEFPSELVAVLRNPIGTKGRIDSLAFTALGANAHMVVAFDEGRTIFVGETLHGQLARLIKIRIGRVAVLWNRARHVIVYERSAVPGMQFVDEQEINGSATSRGWPILRKAEEYVEPIERVRAFADEAQVKDNRAGFIRASEFITPRVYVNGAWGRDIGHGYEIPLWNEADESGFYPKPALALQAHAGGAEMVRCLLDEPQHLYFYTNTEPGKGDDTDAWASYRGVDQPLSTPRLKVVTTVPGNYPDSEKQNRIIDARHLPAPRLGGLRRPRFDMKVVPDGKVDLQHARGETEMLAVMDMVTVMRSVADAADAECLEGVPSGEGESSWATDLDEIKLHSNLAGQVAAAQALRAKAQAFIEQACERIAARAACDTVKEELENRISELFSQAREDLDASMRNLPAPRAPTGLLTRAVDELERELVGLERSMRAPFDKMLADLEALRARARGDVDEVQVAVAQFDSDVLIAKSVLGVAQKAAKEWTKRLKGVVSTTQGDVEALLVQAKQEVDGLIKVAQPGAKAPDIQVVVDICDKALASLRQLEHHRVYGNVLARCADAISGVRASFRLSLTDQAWAELQGGLASAAQGLSELLQTVINVAKIASSLAQVILDRLDAISAEILQSLDESAEKLRKSTAASLAAVLQEINIGVERIHANAGLAVENERDDLLRQWRIQVVMPQMLALRGEVEKIEAGFAAAMAPVLAFAKLAAELLNAVVSKADDWLAKAERDLQDFVKALNCAEIEELRAEVHRQLQAVEEQMRDRITGLATSLIDESTQARFRDLETRIREKIAESQPIADDVAKGMKLVKAIGELPQLPTLTFNAERAEYVFSDLRQQIETSPFAAKLREIDGGLKELGLSIPTQELLDQIVPNSLKNVDFNKVFRNLGGMDFADFFKRFRLPEIHKDQLRVTHGVDKRTRTAWVSTRVDVQFNEEKSLFEVAGLAVTLAKMDMKAASDLSVGLDGEQSSRTEAKLKGDWGLLFSGARLATFRDVTVRYDGAAFGFDIEPKKVELHPALKFVDEFAKRFAPKLPPAVELLRDERGIPMGAKAQMRTEVELPPFGIVEIGPMLIRSGMSLRLTPAGKFQMEANVSVGSRDAPVWVQVGYLGGGMWLEARANYDEKVRYEANVGLALGSVRAVNIAGVARGSFAFLLYAYASISDQNGGSFRAGLQVAGNARILGTANASVLLLLEAVHDGGKTEGRGVLDVSIEICWCYTLHVRKDVNHKID